MKRGYVASPDALSQLREYEEALKDLAAAKIEAQTAEIRLTAAYSKRFYAAQHVGKLEGGLIAKGMSREAAKQAIRDMNDKVADSLTLRY